MKIIFETEMEALPNNCLECKMLGPSCTLGIKEKTGGSWDPKKKYCRQRHEDCPLRVMELTRQTPASKLDPTQRRLAAALASLSKSDWDALERAARAIVQECGGPGSEPTAAADGSDPE